MEYLFNNIAYPIVASEDDVIEAFAEPSVRAVILRDDTLWQQDKQIIAPGITMTDAPNVARRYHYDPSEEFNRKKAGDISYTDVINVSDMLEQSSIAAIDVAQGAADLLTQRVNEKRALFSRLHDRLFGSFDDESVVGHLMFTPKGGVGRAPMMHVDNVRMTMHTTYAGASLRLLNGMITDKLWDGMNHTKMHALPQDVRDHKEAELTFLTEQYAEEFSGARIGDDIFMKGQLGKDLDDLEIRQSMGVHASSPYVSFQGQAASIYYSKKTLDIA